MRDLCAADSIPDGGARGFGPAPGGFTGLFAVRRGDQLFVYVNACPHLRVSLDTPPGRFLSADGETIVCGTHGARFTIEDGVCTAGPCVGDELQQVPPASWTGGYWCRRTPGCSVPPNEPTGGSRLV